MKRLYLPLTLLLVLISEGVALEFLPARLTEGNTMIIPHWVLIVLILSSIFYDRDNTWYSVSYAVVFGFLIDIAYTGVLGVYMFAYTVAVYVAVNLQRFLQPNLYTTLLISILVIAISDSLIEIIYTMVGLANIAFSDYIMVRLVPTILANIIFMIILYPVAKGRLINWSK